jgi:radical SAM protein with 4Fe4S-binding SPASM domain
MTIRKRFIIRKEYFGAYVFDRDLQLDYIFDVESAEAFSVAFTDPSRLEPQDYANMQNLNFILEDGTINFDYFENEIFGEVFSAPIVAHFPYTNKCNLNCKHCFSKAGETSSEMPFEQKLKVLDKLQGLGVCKLLIGGGEPFLCDDFIRFLVESVNRGFVTKAFTNGLCLNEEIIVSLSELNLGGVSVSVDSACEKIYNDIRGIDGLSVIIGNIKKLAQECSFPIAISATIGKYNLTHEDELLDLAKECGVAKLKIRPVRPSGNAKKNSEILTTAEEYADYIKRIQQAYYRNKLHNFFRLDLNWGSGKIIASKTKLDLSKIANPYGEFGCIAGKNIILINPDGTVLTCGFLPNITEYQDNIINSDIIDIWKNSPNFRILRELQVNETCYRCRYYCSCRGGCPARNIHENLSFTDIDPWCPKKYFPISLKEQPQP